MTDQNGAAPRQQPPPVHPSTQSSQPSQTSAAYPSPHSYSSPSIPSMQPTYTYSPSQGGPSSTTDQYRASPTDTSIPVGGLNLPPIRAIDDQTQHQAHQQQQQQPQQPPASPIPGYYPHPPGQHLPPPRQSITMQYGRPPLQCEDQRMMSGGRHKKEIKRRTKTGCLTCRKRRIKCDETHPTCRNCQKSKRDCLGYDPIFKQQTGPAALQPAPPAPSSTPTTPVTPAKPATPASSTAPLLSGPAYSHSHSHIPQGYAPAVSAGYPSPAAATSNDQIPAYSAIDPALAASAESGAMASSAYDPALTARQEAKAPAGVGSPYAAVGIHVRRNNIDELFAYAGLPPLPTPSDIAINIEELKKLYINDYAPGLDKLLETTWYSSQGLEYLSGNTPLLKTFEFLRQKFLLAAGPSQYEAARQIPSLEAKVTWQLLCLCRNGPPTHVNGTNGIIPDAQMSNQHQLAETKARLDILEHLLTGQPLGTNPVQPLSYPNVPEQDPKRYQIDFWNHLGTYVSSSSSMELPKTTVDSALAGMRSILHQLENRDVIYSIAIVRYIGAKPEIASQLHGQQLHAWSNPDDDQNKLFVAKRFLEEESQNGMTQVIARFAGMAVTGWNPAPR